MKLSAIILTWNSERYIKRCLDSLMGDLIESGIDFEIFVIDNGSTDETVKILKKYKDKINLIVLGKNKGTTWSRNLAIRKSKGEYIMFLDSDAEIRSGTILKLLSLMEKHKDIGIVAPKLILEDGTMQISYKKFPTLFIKIIKIIPLNFLRGLSEKMEYYDFSIDKNKIYPVDYCISACWMMPRKIIDQIGLLDEKIFYAPEDVDFCLRVWLAGFKVVYYPDAEVLHYCQRVSYKNPLIAISHFRGLLYYFKKHGYWFSMSKIYGKIRK